ncbi:M1 family metallopeptidase [Caulobacter sp. BE254]|uniref:M1 family metallopeptidase n=1 Tax=Caulobacter sp. BE254 TaxID=2817720 RepID=UPI002860A8C9|nr:M1 family metallopeptidase [Caulobacter sp. BE254]MDR7115287.1 aminopeptidase N [Caulobacter sp. BE254]
MLVFAAGSTLAATVAPARSAAAAATVTTQLPRGVVPTHYDLAFTPDADKLSFTASVKIDIEVAAPTRTITLQAADLTFARAQIAGPGGANEGAAKVSVDAQAQTATFTFDKPVAKGAHVLAIDYSGKIYKQAAGLFALDYDTAQGKKRALYTQFENSDARRFIPSWDEPFFKATYDVQVTVPTGQMAVGNMPISKTQDLGGGKSKVTFATSPRMSTYLLFFALGEFDRATAKVGDVEMGVITKKGDLAKADFALKSAGPILQWYNDYFGAPYPLPKLDHIAAPGQSQFFGAMENWGAIFYFEYYLLDDPAISTQADRQAIYTVVAHEMAHQWFGDLVTMSWWDDLWLNEGFASWMESRAAERFHPEWNVQLASVANRETAMGLDSLSTAHPVVQHVETVDQASQAFDAITYEKGEAVIRMLEAYVGPDAWRDGVRAYIKAHAHGSSTTDDLWVEVEKAAGKPITAIAHDFTLQPGVPLITVDAGACAAGKTPVTLTQGEFSRDKPTKTPLAWRVPVSAQVAGSSTVAKTLVEGGKGSLSVAGCGPVVVNAGQAGYFRTLYTPKAFAGVSASFAKLPAIDQLGVISDAWALGLNGQQPVTDALDLVMATPADADPQVWGKVASILTNIDGMYDGAPAERAAFRKLAVARLSPVFQQVGWTAKAGEPGPVATLRATLITSLGTLGDAAVIAEAKRRYAADKTDPTAVPGPLRKPILAVVGRNADAAAWDALRAQAQAEKTPLIRDQLYTQLASAADPALAAKALALALTDEPSETLSANMISTVDKLHPDMAFDFAVAHKDAVNGKVDAASRTKFIPSLAKASADPAMVGKVTAYAAANLPAGSRGEAGKSVASITDRIKTRKAALPQITAWTAKKG